MKLSLQWLKDFVANPWGASELGARLTMAGFELEGSALAAPPFTGVVVAEIVSCEKHPQADKLQVCQVATGLGPVLQVVCGARNARAGLRTALATVGAVLPGDLRINAAKLRGVDSAGMLCSTKELGLADLSDGIVELPADAPLGADVRTALGLDDEILEIAITPNRGDAMSVLGLAREVAALTGGSLHAPATQPVAAQHADNVPVTLVAGAGCPTFVGRLIRGVNNRAPTPLWMRERLRRAGVRSISPVVDVTNYVLQELGQPMHAYDAGKLQGGITVRKARAQEPLTLLDGEAVSLADDMLVIADEGGAVGLAGAMGGERTAVSAGTEDVLLEVAWFEPQAIAGRPRRLGVTTDASQRFERGVDPQLQERAMDRATELLRQIAGGSPGPVAVHRSGDTLPARLPVTLRRGQLARLLGFAPDAAVVADRLAALGMRVDEIGDGWRVTPPSHRFDIAIEADLIEEVARQIGLATIPEIAPRTLQRFAPMPEAHAADARIMDLLAARGFQEAIHFAFVDPAWQRTLFPAVATVRLTNPIADNLAVMRVSLWPGLLQATRDNIRRQQDRVRLFELGTVFDAAGRETEWVAGVSAGLRHAEQWATARDEVKIAADFFDLRADLAALLSISGDLAQFEFRAGGPGCLHPGRCATILKSGQVVGHLGELHPDVTAALDLTYAPQVFELRRDALGIVHPRVTDLSRQPQVRRDLAVVVDEAITFSQLHDRVISVASSLLRELRCFDVYRGAGVESGRKSVALGLIFQDNLKTLTDEDADRLMSAIRSDLGASLNARIRE